VHAEERRQLQQRELQGGDGASEEDAIVLRAEGKSTVQYTILSKVLHKLNNIRVMIYFPFSCRLNAGGKRSWSTLVSSITGTGAETAQAPVTTA